MAALDCDVRREGLEVKSRQTQNKGFVSVRSKLGAGTTFEIYLPLIETVPTTSLSDLKNKKQNLRVP